MSWSIDITADGWDNIQNNLEMWSKKKLAAAIRDDYYEKNEKRYPVNLSKLPHDTLVNNAFELVRENNSCDNGGWNAWIDKEGWHKVSISAKGEESWEKYP